MMRGSELRLQCHAGAADVKLLRHALTSFLDVFRMDQVFLDDVSLAVGEVLANAVEHSCGAGDRADLELIARAPDTGMLTIDVHDRGNFLVRERQPGRGFGLEIVRAIAREVSIDTGSGTCVHMVFSLS